MSSSVDSRIVSMKFDNSSFEKGVSKTMATMAKLKSSLNLSSAGSAAAKGLSGLAGNLGKLNPFALASKGLQQLKGDAAKFELGGVEGAVTHVSKSFLAMATVGITALSNITSKAISAGTAWIKSFTLSPILDGLHEYQTNLQAIQTVQANTDQPLSKVNASLTELNKFSDKTIYNFGQMAKNVGTFTAAGVDLKTSVSSIKGIATMAALSGSTSEQAATAMYQLSQAISSGRVGLQDWNSVVNAGMGGKKLQNALGQTAVAMGLIDKNAVKMVGPMKKLTINGESFRESIETKPGRAPWLTSDVLVNTLATLDGRFSKTALRAELTSDGLRKYSDAQIKAKIATARHNLEMKNGVKYTDAQFKSLMHLSDSAFKSATEVKTLGQVFDIAKETIGSGWSASFQSIFGTLGEAKKTFTALSGTINGYINANALARNKVLHDWKALGGRTMLIDGIKNAWEGLLSVLKPIHDAFRDIFPRMTGVQLRDLTKSFRDFTENLTVSQKTADGIRGTFGALFAVLHIVGQVLFGIIKYFVTFAGLIAGGTGSVFQLTGSIGDLLVKLDQWLSKGDFISKFFDAIIAGRNAVYGPVIDLISTIISAFAALIKDGPEAFVKTLSDIPAILGRFAAGVGQLFLHIFGPIYLGISWLLDHMGPLGQSIKDFGSALGGIFENAWRSVLDFISSLGSVGETIANALGGGGIDAGGFASIFDSIQTSLEPVLAWLTNAFNQAFAVITPIAVAFGNVLLGVFQQIPGAIQSVLGLFGSLGSALGSIFGGVSTGDAGGGLSTLTASLEPAVGMADKVKNAFTDLGAAIGPAMHDAGNSMADFAHGVVTAAGLVIKFIGLVIKDIYEEFAGLASGFANLPNPVTTFLKNAFVGVKDLIVGLFAGMGLEDVIALVDGLLMGGVLFTLYKFVDQVKGVFKSVTGFFDEGAGAFGQLSGTLETMQKEVRANIILKIAGALLVLAAALWILSTIPMKQLVVSLGALVGGLTAMTGAMAIIQKSIQDQSMKDAAKVVLVTGAMIGMGVALIALATAVKIFSTMSPGELAKGLGSVGVAIIALIAMAKILNNSGAGGEMVKASFSLLILAAAMTAMAGAIKLFSVMDWGGIIDGVAKIAVVLVALGLSMRAMPPDMLANAAALFIVANALIILSGALAAMGALNNVGKSLVVLGLSLLIIAVGMAAMTEALPGAAALLVVAAALAILTPSLVALGSMDLASIGKAMLVLAGVFTILGLAGLILTPVIPSIIALGIAIAIIGAGALMAGAGLFLMAAGLAALAISGAAGGVALAGVIVAIAMTFPVIAAQFGLALVVLAKMIGRSGVAMTQAFGAILGSLLNAITRNIPKMGKLFSQLLSTGLRVIVGFIPKVISAGFKLIIGFLNAISKNAPKIIRIAGDIIVKFINGIGKQAGRIADAGARTIIKFINGLSRAIDNHSAEMGRAGGRLATSIIRGLVSGIGNGIGQVATAARNLARSALDSALNFLHINSPSRVFRDQVGKSIPEGMAAGIRQYSNMSDRASEEAGLSALDVMRSTMAGLADVVDSDIDSNPVIAPVLDLNQLQKEAARISGFLPDVKMGAGLSFNRASAISADTLAAMEAQFASSATADERGINFTQINNSPEPLNPITIYRNTKNLTALAKEALK